MLHETQDLRLWQVKQRMNEIRDTALEARGLPRDSAAAPRVPRERRFSGLRLQIGQWLIMVGRTFTEDDSGCADALQS
jgi:hypothetical protein